MHWTQRSVGKPWKDKGGVFVIVASDREDGDLESQAQNSVIAGAKLILEADGLKYDDDTILQNVILSREDRFTVEDYYIHPRSTRTLLTLVGTKEILLNDLQSEDVELDSVNYVSFDTNHLSDILSNSEAVFEAYAELIGERADISLTYEYQQLRGLVSALIALVEYNGMPFPHNREEKLEIGADGEWRIDFVSVTQDSVPIRMKAGWPQFKANDIVARTNHYLFHLEDISETDYYTVKPVEFLEQYTIPLPTILPANSTDIVEFDTSQIFMDYLNKVAEDQELQDIDFLTSEYDRRKNEGDSTSDPLLSDPQGLAGQVTDIKSAFMLVLNRIPIESFINELMSCITFQIPDIPVDFDFQEGIPFEIPTIELPDNMPTVDIMSGMTGSIKEMLLQMLTEMFVELVVGILSEISVECPSGAVNGYGGYDGSDVLPSDTNAENDLSNDIGEELGVDEYDTLKEWLTDLSAMLNYVEFCSLFTSSVSNELLDTVLLFTERKYPFLYVEGGLNSRTKLKRIFSILSRYVGDNFCSQIVNNYRPNSTGPCGSQLDFIRQTLSADDVSEEEIDRMLEGLREYKEQRALQLSEIMNKGLTGDRQFDVFGENGVLNGGSHESVDYLADKTFDTIFNGIYQTFNTDADGYADAMIINLSRKDSIQNESDPKLVAMGYTQDMIEDQDFPIAVDSPRRLVSPRIKDALTSLEGDLQLRKGEDPRTRGYDLLLPPDPNMQQAFELIELPDENPTELEEYESQLSEWNIYYAIPVDKEYPSEDEICEDEIDVLDLTPFNIDDEYLIVLSDRGEEKYRDRGSAELSEETEAVLDTITANVNNRAENTPQQEVFGEFVKNLWKEKVTDPTLLTEYRNLKEFYAGPIFAQIYRDIFVEMAGVITESPYFKVRTQTVDISKDGASYSSVYDLPYIQSIDLTPSPGVDQQGCGIDLHMLGIEQIKNELKAEFASVPFEPPMNDGTGRADPSDLERIALSGVVTATVRAYLVDYMLRGIFAFTVFKLQSGEVDELMVKYFIYTMQQEMKGFGGNYFEEFNKFIEIHLEQNLDDIVREEMSFVVDKFVSVVGANPNAAGLLEEFLYQLPLVKAQKTIMQERFASSTYTNLRGKEVKSDITNGQLFIEEHLRVVDYDTEEEILSDRGPEVQQIRQSVFNRDKATRGVVNIETFFEYMNSIGLNGLRWCDLFKSVTVGWRINHIAPPSLSTQFIGRHLERNARDHVTSQGPSVVSRGDLRGQFNFRKLTTLPVDYADENKDIRCLELGMSGRMNDGNPIIREVNILPLVEEELSSEWLNDLEFGSTSRIPERQMSIIRQVLMSSIMRQDRFKFLFEYVFPIRRIFAVLAIFTILGTSDQDRVPHVFDETKEELVRVFLTLLNAGDYRYEDPGLECIGGDTALKGIQDKKAAEWLKQCAPLPTLCPPSFSFGGGFIAKMALLTPIMMLKGLAELVDPNIAIASKIQNFICLPMPFISFGLLPSNVFPPPVGIGPPLTPLGIFYLALGIGMLDIPFDTGIDDDDMNQSETCDNEDN